MPGFRHAPAVAAPTCSVVVCAFTTERLELLGRALASVRSQTSAADQVVLVVDHAPDLLTVARERWPDVDVVASRGPRGLSAARNTGIEESTGEVVAFLDDDAAAAPDWLARLRAAYADPSVLGAGGDVRPAWQSGRPSWFPPEFDWVVGCAHSGMPAEARPVRNLIGANMSLRREVLLEVGGFRHELGRVGSIPAGCEETDLCIRVGRARPGGVILYDPQAVVDHVVPRARAGLRYFTSRCAAEGRSKAILAALVGPGAGLAAERDYTRHTLPAGLVRGLRQGVRGDAGGVRRAAMITVGLAATAGGYAAGRVRASGARRRTARAAARDPDPAEGPLRVLMVTPHDPLGTGGVERHVMEVGRRLAAGGAVVEVLCAGRATRPEPTMRDGVTIRTLRTWPQGGDLRLTPGLWRAMARDRWDVVHVQSYHTLVAPLAMLRAYSLGIPYIVTFHGGGHSSRLRHALRGVQRRALRPLLRRAARLVALAPFEIAQYGRELAVDAGRFTLIPNGTDLPPAVDEPAPARSGSDAGGLVLATIGRLERYKGHDRVIEALPHVRERRPDARLLVVGRGPHEAALRRQVARLGLQAHVAFASVPAGDAGAMAALLRRVTVVALFSDFETHPLVALEAAAAGCRLVVADTGGLGDVVRAGLASGVPPRASAPDRARAILRAVDGPAPAVPTGLLSWDRCAAELSLLYAEVSGAAAAGAA